MNRDAKSKICMRHELATNPAFRGKHVNRLRLGSLNKSCSSKDHFYGLFGFWNMEARISNLTSHAAEITLGDME
jgi:hypothetical protein